MERTVTAEAVLATLLNGDAETVHKGLSVLEVEDFEHLEHKQLFAAIKDAAADGSVDIVSVSNKLGGDSFEWVTGLAKDAYLYDYAFDQHVSELREERKKREIQKGLTELLKMADDGEDVTSDIQELVDRTKTIGVSNLETAGDIAVEAVAEVFEAKKYIPTGFTDLDKVIGGISAGRLIVIGGRPSMGKSTLAMNIAANVSKNGKPVLYFSIEDSKKELMRRMCYFLGETTERLVKTNEGEKAKFIDTANLIKDFELPIYVHDNAATAASISREAWKVKQKCKELPLIVVDYLGLITPAESKKNISRTQEIGEITRALKLLALDIGATVILCAQLNRGSDSGAETRKPRLSDLRESGAIEQDADIVLFPFREEFDKEICEAEINIAKNRNGRTGSIKVVWFGGQFRFANAELRR